MVPEARPPLRQELCGGPALWQFSRHADVAQALREPRLVPPGPGGGDGAAHRAVRAAVEAALAPARLAAWRDDFAALAHGLIDALPGGPAADPQPPEAEPAGAVPVDLVAAFAQPWSLAVAQSVTGLSPEAAARGEPLARQLFDAAAHATDGTPAAAALQAASALAQAFAAETPTQRGLADVQTFVALSQSLPALLAGAWLALLQQPEAQAQLRAAPAAVARAAGELLRLGSPAQIVFREAAEDLTLAGVSLRRGERVALLIAAANRDPACFADPERLDLARPASAHLALGGGAHGCAGAALVRLALTVATQALLSRSAQLALADAAPLAVDWRGGLAMRAPAALPVLWLPQR